MIMSDNVITTPAFTEAKPITIGPSHQNQNLYGLAQNYANSNKWIAYLPIEDALGSSYKSLELHLVRFSIPQLEMGSMETSYKGYKKLMPTKVLAPETKELTLEYLIDSEWLNYKALYAWMSGIEGTINPVVANEQLNGVTPGLYMPMRIYLLSPYKKKIIQFLFSNCWIKLFNDLALEQNNPNEITHSITLSYDQFTIESV